MEADNAPKWWHADISKIERKHAEIMHISINNTLNGGENTRTYPIEDTAVNFPAARILNLSTGYIQTSFLLVSTRWLKSRFHCVRRVLNPLTPCCDMTTAIKHPLSDRVSAG